MTRIARMKTPRIGSVAKAWTDVTTPERTRNVPISESENVRIASRMVHAVGVAMFIRTASPLRVPTIGIIALISASPSASISAECPSSGIIRRASSARSRAQEGRSAATRCGSRVSFDGSAAGCSGLPAVIILPVPGSLQRIGDFFGHIGFIVLGEYRVRLEGAARIERAFRYDALPLAE